MEAPGRDVGGRLRLPCSTVARLLRRSLLRVLGETRCDCIALSGGIDTSLIAVLAVQLGLRLRAYTSLYLRGVPRDLPYADHLGKALGLNVTHVLVDDEYIENKIGLVKRCVGVEDDYIELRNDIVFYSVLEEARRDGCRCIYTGSGGDEVFAGYGFMVYKDSRELEELTARYALHGRYPELIIGKCLGINVVAPYLTGEVLGVALKTPVECLRDHRMRGKEILRSLLVEEGFSIIAGRVKTPAEAGAGTDKLTKL